MNKFLVGGAIRDKLLGGIPKDLDYIVVGSTPEEMLNRGFTQVGADFPVFLHPETGDEYALARKEIKTGVGYNGFTCTALPHVTLEEDLSRRDLTINAMAETPSGRLVDPFGGQKDIADKVLRHTTEAFSDDPVRVLRVARFLARYGYDWSVAPETLLLCRKLVRSDDWNHLTAERVWLETEKALKERNSERFFSFLKDIGEYTWFGILQEMKGIPQPKEHHPEGDVLAHTLLCMKVADTENLTPEEKFAVFCHDFGKPKCHRGRGVLHGHEEEGVPLIDGFCNKLKAPKSFRNLATQVSRWHTHCHKALDLKPKTLYKVLHALGEFQGKSSVESFLRCCRADARGRAGYENSEYLQSTFFKEVVKGLSELNLKEISSDCLRKGLTGKDIGEKIRIKRIDKIREVKRVWKS